MGPERREEPRFGSLAGSGKEARCVGGGEPEAADIVEDGLDGGSGLGWAEGDGGRDGTGEAEGEVANGFGGSESSILLL